MLSYKSQLQYRYNQISNFIEVLKQKIVGIRKATDTEKMDA